MQCSKLDMRGADAGAGGMSISSGSGGASGWPSPRAPALEAAEDGHVEGLQVRRELLLHGGHRGLAGVDAGRVPEKDPRLSFLDRVQHVVQNGRELQDRCRRGPAVKHRTSVTFMMCSCSRVMSAGDSMLLLPRVSARGALRFQR